MLFISDFSVKTEPAERLDPAAGLRSKGTEYRKEENWHLVFYIQKNNIRGDRR